MKRVGLFVGAMMMVASLSAQAQEQTGGGNGSGPNGSSPNGSSPQGQAPKKPGRRGGSKNQNSGGGSNQNGGGSNGNSSGNGNNNQNSGGGSNQNGGGSNGNSSGNGNNNNNSNGNGKPNGGTSSWTPEKCQSEASNLPSQAAECLKVSDFNGRRGCFQTLGNSHPNDFFDACHAQIDPIKSQVLSQEKTLYPNQASAVDGDGSGNNNNGNNNGNGNQNQPNNGGGNRGRNGKGMAKNGGPNNGRGTNNQNGNQNGGQNNGQNNNQGNNKQSSNWTPEKCQTEASNLPSQAAECLKASDFNARRGCFQTLGDSHPNDFFDACHAQIDPIKSQVLSQEKTLYPNQASAVDGDGSGNNNNGNSNYNQQANNGGGAGTNAAAKAIRAAPMAKTVAKTTAIKA